MSRIHHSQASKAEKIGVRLEEQGQFIKAIWPARNLHVFGVDARWAIEQMEAAQRLVKFAEDRGNELSLKPSLQAPTMVHLIIDGEETKGVNAPMVWWNSKEQIQFNGEPEKTVLIKVVGPSGEPIEDVDENDESVDEESTEEKKPASVVKQRYRAKYAELGHPTTCGDELAQKLDNLVHNKGGTNIELVDMLAKANEINLDKYSRTTPGWQGRLRMTFRNMLAKRVHANGGVLKLPEGWPEGSELKMSQEWMSLQRFQK